MSSNRMRPGLAAIALAAMAIIGVSLKAPPASASSSTLAAAQTLGVNQSL